MAKNRKGIIRIGISNVVVPGNKTSFPPEYQSGSRLHYYGSLFDTVEINSSFYKTPMRSTVERWAKETPPEFRFSFKLNKEITHVKNLDGDWSILPGFMHAMNGANEKKGCLLVQFPGKITLDYFDKVHTLLQSIQDTGNNDFWRIAIEFRHPGWYIRETAELANEFGAAIVLHDIPKSKISEIMSDAQFIYIRYHGPKGDYRDSYTKEFLQSQASRMKQWSKERKDVYAYFNNTIGAAFENAQTLQSMIRTGRK
jgi:uncharacterized protein YecE (DUF72 family)